MSNNQVRGSTRSIQEALRPLLVEQTPEVLPVAEVPATATTPVIPAIAGRPAVYYPWTRERSPTDKRLSGIPRLPLSTRAATLFREFTDAKSQFTAEDKLTQLGVTTYALADLGFFAGAIAAGGLAAGGGTILAGNVILLGGGAALLIAGDTLLHLPERITGLLTNFGSGFTGFMAGKGWVHNVLKAADKRMDNKFFEKLLNWGSKPFSVPTSGFLKFLSSIGGEKAKVQTDEAAKAKPDAAKAKP
jgi:hypothetical protein